MALQKFTRKNAVLKTDLILKSDTNRLASNRESAPQSKLIRLSLSLVGIQLKRVDEG